MPLWISKIKGRLDRKGTTREAEKVVSQQQAAVPDVSIPVEKVGFDVEAWLDGRAGELNGDWVLARLAGLSRGDGAATRQLVAAALLPTEELRVEPSPGDLYHSTAMRIRTVEGTWIGYLEPTAAETISRQMRAGDLVRCFVYSVTPSAEDVPSSVMLALMSWAHSSGARP